MSCLSSFLSAGDAGAERAPASIFGDVHAALLVGGGNVLTKIAAQLRMHGICVVEVPELRLLSGAAALYQPLAVVGSSSVSSALADLLDAMVDSGIYAPIIAVVDKARTEAVFGDSIAVLGGLQGAALIALLIGHFWRETGPEAGSNT